MTTATPTRPLAEILRERWETGYRDNRVGTSDNAVSDAITTLAGQIIDPYRVGIDSVTGEYVLLGGDWHADLDLAVERAGQDAWEQHVVPAVVAAIVERLPKAPQWLLAHPDHEQLRADLAALEADR